MVKTVTKAHQEIIYTKKDKWFMYKIAVSGWNRSNMESTHTHTSIRNVWSEGTNWPHSNTCNA